MAVEDVDGRAARAQAPRVVAPVRVPPSVRAAEQRQADRIRRAVVARFMRRLGGPRY
jgi:hypothetical protein